jgi:ACS family glucarate transporter-like MFS transporter
LAFLIYWLTTDHPVDHRWVNAAELRHINHGQESTAEPHHLPGPVPWRVLLFSRTDLWFLTAAYFTLGYILYIYFSWFYLYLVNVRGFSMLSGGWYSTAPFLASAITSPIGGWLSDALSRRYGKRIGRCGLGIGSLLITSCLIWAGASATDPYLAIILLALGSASLFLSAGAFWATTMDLASTYAGTVSGFMNMGGNLGGAISPTLTPYIAQHYGWETALFAAAALAIVGAGFWLGVHPERAIDLQRADSPIVQPTSATASAVAREGADR